MHISEVYHTVTTYLFPCGPLDLYIPDMRSWRCVGLSLKTASQDMPNQLKEKNPKPGSDDFWSFGNVKTFGVSNPKCNAGYGIRVTPVFRHIL